jgi:hypothetical protein
MNLAWLRIGDILRFEGIEYIVEMVNDSRARCQPLSSKGDRDFSISPRTEPGFVTRRATDAERKRFLEKVNASPTPDETTEAFNEDDNMKKDKTTTETTEARTRTSYAGFGKAARALQAKGMTAEAAREKLLKTYWPVSIAAVQAVFDAKPKAPKAAKVPPALKKAVEKPAAKAKAAPAAKTPPAKKTTPPAPKPKVAAKAPPVRKGPPPPKTAAPAPAEEAPATETPAEGFAEAAA